MNMHSKIEIIPMGTDRLEVIEQALHIMNGLPEGDSIRTELLRAAAKVWMLATMPPMMFATPSEAQPPEQSEGKEAPASPTA